MSKEKQIEDFENDLRECHTEFSTSDDSMDLYTDYKITAQNMINKDWRKQSKGEWEQYGLRNPKCSLCRKYNTEKSDFCPHCGAKMKGGAE